MYCRILKGAFRKSNWGNLNSLILHSPPLPPSPFIRPARTRFDSTFLNKYTEFPPQTRLSPESVEGFCLVLKRVQPIPARDRENASMVSIRSPVSRKNREIEQQSQLLVLSVVALLVEWVELIKASLKRPLESVAKERRCVREAVVREGNGRGTASFGKEWEESEEDDHDIGNGDDGDGVDEEEVDGDDDEDGYKKMMWERDGVGYKSMPMSLAMVASLYVSAMSSLVGRNRSSGVFVPVILSALLLLLLLLLLVV